MASSWGNSWGSSWGDSWGVVGAIVVQSIAPIVGRMLIYPALEGEASIKSSVDDARVYVYPKIVGDVGGT